MRFRAILIDPGNRTQERPLQILGKNKNEIDRWTKVVLERAISAHAWVEVYQMIEQQVGLVVKPKKIEPEPEKPPVAADDSNFCVCAVHVKCPVHPLGKTA